MGTEFCTAAGNPRLVGDPVDTLSGAVVDRMLDFRLTGTIELRWYRQYDSSRCGESFSVGRGCAHEFDRSLTMDAEGFEYQEAVRPVLRFPTLMKDGDEWAGHGYRLRRIASGHFILSTHAQPAMEFVFRAGVARARLSRLLHVGAEVRFHYDDDGRLIRIDDSAGRTLTAREDEAFRLVNLSVDATATTPGYLLIAYEYDDHGNLIRTRDTHGNGYAFEYDENHRVVLRRGRKGFQFHYRYDEQGRCIRSMGDDRLHGVALDYAIPGRLTRVTHPDRGVWTYQFTQQGGLASIADPLGGVQKFVRDPVSNLPMQEVDPNGNVYQFAYDGAGAQTAKIGPLGHRETVPEDVNAPDPLANPVAANAAEYEYGRWLNVEAIVVPTARELDALGLPVEIRPFVAVRPAGNGVGGSHDYQVPPLRILWWPKPQRGRHFNDLGKLLMQRDDFGRERQWSYDASGNLAEHVDFDGGVWKYDYGTYHFLGARRNPCGAEVRFTHTTYGEVASFTDAAGTRSEYAYDLKNRLVGIRRHGVVKETYRRDAVGNLVAKHAADGRELLRMEIGPGNLPVRRTLASGDEHTFAYDKSGRFLLAATRHDRVEYKYDLIGNCVLERRNGLGVEHRHQGWRTPAESVFFGRYKVRYQWEGETLTLTDPAGGAHVIRFHAHGLVQRRFSNGSHETSQYDGLGRCLFKRAKRANGEIWARRYEWSGEGELRSSSDTVRGDVKYDYDAAHRLCGRSIGDRAEQFMQDDADNLLQQPGLEQAMLIEGNRLGWADGEEFRYNDRNNVDSRHGANGATRYFYDSRDQLVRAETPGGVWEARYDARGRRTARTWNGKSTEFYWNGDQLIAEVDHTGKLRLYIYADSLALSPLVILDYASIDAPPESGRRLLVFADQIGTPCLLEDDAGNEAWRADIAPFGSATVRSGANLDFNLSFPGHYRDSALGLHYNRFRYYDPRLGRYLQSDPWGISGGYNLYAYRTNPLGSVDVLGLGEDGNPNCRPREEDAEDSGHPQPPDRRRMTDEELQSAADHIRHGGGPRPDDWSTLTVTEGMEDGRPVHTVTTSRPGGLTDGERGRAEQVFGPSVRTPEPDRPPPGDNTFHAEQRGARATEGQEDRVQASSNQTATTRRDPDVGHMGAACDACAACQRDSGIRNATGTVEDGGRTNNPPSGAWRGYP